MSAWNHLYVYNKVNKKADSTRHAAKNMQREYAHPKRIYWKSPPLVKMRVLTEVNSSIYYFSIQPENTDCYVANDTKN